MQPNQQPTSPVQPELPPTGPPNSNVGGTVLPPAASASPRRKRMMLIATVAVVGLLGASAAGYFGVVVPNKPENLWSRALDNTAKGYDKIVENIEEQKDAKAVKADGAFKLEGAVAADGTFEMISTKESAEIKADVGAAGARINLESRMFVPANSTNPDVYLKVTGLKGIGALVDPGGANGIAPVMNKVENQWIVLDHTFFDQLQSSMGGQTPVTTKLTVDDSVQIARSIGKVNKEYLWTDNSDKAVFTMAQKVGKEKRDDRDVYHYKVGYHKEHLKAYATAMRDELKNTKLVEMAPNKDINKLVNFDEMIKAIEKTKGTETADVWVDMDTKLVRAVRFSDAKEQNNFFEVGLKYTGGDEIPLYMTVKAVGDDPVDATLTILNNLKTDTSKIEAVATFGGSGGANGKFTAHMNFKPHNEDVKLTKPDGAKPVTEVLGDVLPIFGSAAPLGAVESDAE